MPALVTRSPRVEDLPAVRGLVPRRLLFDRLSALGPGEVGLLCAPAGSGKTALVRSWAASEELADRVAWVSVERAEVPDRVQPAGPVHGGVRSG